MTIWDKLKWRLHRALGHKITLVEGEYPICECGWLIPTAKWKGWA